jgi:hypothetical protein
MSLLQDNYEEANVIYVETLMLAVRLCGRGFQVLEDPDVLIKRPSHFTSML